MVGRDTDVNEGAIQIKHDTETGVIEHGGWGETQLLSVQTGTLRPWGQRTTGLRRPFGWMETILSACQKATWANTRQTERRQSEAAVTKRAENA